MSLTIIRINKPPINMLDASACAWAARSREISAALAILSDSFVKRSTSAASVASFARCKSSSARACCVAARSKNSAPGFPHNPWPICTQATISRIRNDQNIPHRARDADQNGPNRHAQRLNEIENMLVFSCIFIKACE